MTETWTSATLDLHRLLWPYLNIGNFLAGIGYFERNFDIGKFLASNGYYGRNLDDKDAPTVKMSLTQRSLIKEE
jgi:hypothetical protein